MADEITNLSSNILNCFVSQSSETSVETDNSNVRHLTESFKGPYSLGRTVNFVTGQDTPTSVRIKLNTTRTVQQEYATPTNRPGLQWILETVKIDEWNKGGDHCVITCKFREGTPTSIEPGEAYTVKNLQQTWNMTWQSYSMPVSEYCANETKTSLYLNPNEDGTLNLPESIEGTAYWPRIERYLNSKDDQLEGLYAYKDGDLVTALTDHDKLVLEKYILGRQPTFHYPVLTWTLGQSYLPTSADTSSYLSVQYNLEVGDNIDHEMKFEDLSGVCPLKFPLSVWHWIKVGDNVEQTKNNKENTFKHTIQLMGVKDFDVNFYGEPDLENPEKGRWEKNSI